MTGQTDSQVGIRLSVTLNQFGQASNQNWTDGATVLSDSQYLYNNDGMVASFAVAANEQAGSGIPNPYLEGQTPIPGTRRTGVSRAAVLEIKLVQETGEGTLDWTPEEIDDIRQNGELPLNIVGHHINSVAEFPEWAGDPRNIMFVRGQIGNLAEHGGNFQNATIGPLIDRAAMILLAEGGGE